VVDNAEENGLEADLKIIEAQALPVNAYDILGPKLLALTGGY
jgi:hypothetical protein